MAEQALLEVFVMTKNRKAFLEMTLDSVFSQTYSQFHVTVLDNACTDGSESLAAKYPRDRLTWLRSDAEMHSERNFYRAQTRVKGKFVSVFHDDDLYHPRYLETIVSALERLPAADREQVYLIIGGMRMTTQPRAEDFTDFPCEPIFCPTTADFLALLLRRSALNYGSTFFRSESFSVTRPRIDLYGKAADMPFVLDVASPGGVLVLPGPWVQYRIHPGQDGQQLHSGPFLHEIANLYGKYRQILGTSPWRRHGLVHSLYLFGTILMMMRSTGNGDLRSWWRLWQSPALSVWNLLFGIPFHYLSVARNRLRRLLRARS